MSPAQKQSVTEDMLCQFLQNEAKSREFAHFLMVTIGPEGNKWLAQRVFETTAAPEADFVFAKKIRARQLDPEKRRLLEVTSLFRYFEHRKQLLENSLTAQEASELLSVTKQTIHDRTRDGKLIGLLENNVLRLPTFQFDPAGPNGIVAGLPEVMAAVHSSTFGKISWITAANRVFKGRAPIDILKEGRIDEVLEQARSLGVA
ncbi:MAG: hypothetical protein JSS86_21645 [Cyanobacteria bacterium SZAS LIN-2]|nr:hypothetical protein [Cyanobacteria bacterium SZAS LIN-2]